MDLYLLSQDAVTGYDVYDSVVVAAKSEDVLEFCKQMIGESK